MALADGEAVASRLAAGAFTLRAQLLETRGRWTGTAVAPGADEGLFMTAALAPVVTPPPLFSEVSTTLTVAASAAYEIFSDSADLWRWLPIAQAARTVAHYPDGRTRRVVFTRKLDRGSLSYTLEYTYDPADRRVMWCAAEGSNVVLTGEARFVALSMRACLMRYRLVIELPIVDDLVLGELDCHPASQVVSEFREHLRRLC
jgi:uncharacterized membrane protein